MELALEWIILIFLGVSVSLISKFIHDVKEVHKEDCRQMKEKQDHFSNKLIRLETKMDIYLDHSGISVSKTDRKIAEHMEELKQNDRPTVGCINVKELYKDADE